jgi:hypothetical protein
MPRTKPALAVAALAGLALSAAFLPGCGAQAQTDDTLYQYATLNALMAGVYDGSLTIGELERHGDQGLGTVNRLDGEMVMIDETSEWVAELPTDGAFPSTELSQDQYK